MTTNSELAEKFAKGATSGKANHTFIDGDTIYSYGHHFPMATRTKDGFLVNSSKYSVSTSKHQSYVRGAIAGTGKPAKEINIDDLFKEMDRLKEESLKRSKQKLKKLI
jgi:hypothetical protein